MRRPRPRRRRFLAGAVAGAVLGCVVMTVGAALAPAASLPMTVAVTGIDPMELRPDGRITITGSVQGGDTAADAVRIVVRRTAARLSTRDTVDAWRSPLDDSGRLIDMATLDLGVINATAEVPFTVDVDSAAARLGATTSAAGPYGMVIDVEAGPLPADSSRSEASASVRGFLIWSPDVGIQPTGIALVTELPSFDADPATGLIDPDVIDRAAGPRGELATALEVATALPGTWSVDPLLLASATSGPAGSAARGWVRDVRSSRAEREVLLDSWARPSPDLLAASGRDQELRTLLDQVRERPGRTLHADQLLAGAPLTGITVTAPDIGLAGLSSLAAAGQSAVVSEATVPLAEPGRGFTLTGREDLITPGGVLPVLITDVALNAALSDAAAGDPLSTTSLMAEVAAISLQRPNDPRTIGVHLSDPGSGDPAAAARTGAALGASAWVRSVTVSAALALPVVGQARTTPPAPDPATLGAVVVSTPEQVAVTDLLTSADAVMALGEAVADADPVVVVNRRSASAVAASVEAMQAVAAANATQSMVWVDGVRVLEGSSITLAASEAAIPLTVVNELDSDVQLRLTVVSRSPRLRILSAEQSVRLAAGGQASVEVPVEAVSNGRAQVVVGLTTPTEVPWGLRAPIEVQVATGAETGVLTVAALLIAVAFLAGTVRTIRRSQRRVGAQDESA